MKGWANALKEEVSLTDDGFKKLPPGTYLSMITGVEQKQFKTSGSRGLRITYTVTDGPEEGGTALENFVLEKADGSYNEWGGKFLKRRLLAAGFTGEQILNFKAPEKNKDLGDFKKLIGKAVSITVEHQIGEEGFMAGKTMVNIKRVEPVGEVAEQIAASAAVTAPTSIKTKTKKIK